MPILSAIIVNYRTGEYVHRCIDSILTNPPDGGVEVIAIDNASADGSVEELRKRGDITLVENEHNVGYAGGCNAGARLASGEFIMFLNPDVEVGPGVLESLINFLRDTPAAGAAAPQLESFDGRKQESYRRFPTILSVFGARRSPLYRLWPGNPISRRSFYGDLDLDSTGPTPVDAVGGAALIFPRHILETTGGMDPGFFMYLEDIDFCRRISLAGYDVYIVPHVRVTHRWAVSTKKHPYRMTLVHYVSLGRYFYKHNPLRFVIYLAVSPLLIFFALTQWLLILLSSRNS
ncbi:MAG: glycosyltransferase family 2 protein [Candidatus Coatesbacteria bacterium]|nr:MAG: glycosyltransferase family 2 protein [Candidatus Coatesbacteria bacterium]